MSLSASNFWGLIADRSKVAEIPISKILRDQPLISKYLQPEKLVEVDSPEIKAAVGQIFKKGAISGDRSVYETARKIYDWILDSGRKSI